MTVTTKPLVIYDATDKRHKPLGAGDQISGSLIQLDPATTNILQVGPDGGLLVEAPAPTTSFPDDQVFTAGTSDTNLVTLTPSAPNAEGQVDYTVQVDTKINPTMIANLLTATPTGLAVAPPEHQSEFPTGTFIDDTTIPTARIVGMAIPEAEHYLLGTPNRWVKLKIEYMGDVGHVLVPGYFV